MNASAGAPAPASGRRPGRLDRLFGPAFSPHGLLARAVILLLAFALAHAAGLRELTAILSGTVAGTGARDQAAAVLGVIYVLLYLAAVVAVPTLLIAAALLAGLFRLAGRRVPEDGTHG